MRLIAYRAFDSIRNVSLSGIDEGVGPTGTKLRNHIQCNGHKTYRMDTFADLCAVGMMLFGNCNIRLCSLLARGLACSRVHWVMTHDF